MLYISFFLSICCQVFHTSQGQWLSYNEIPFSASSEKRKNIVLKFAYLFMGNKIKLEEHSFNVFILSLLSFSSSSLFAQQQPLNLHCISILYTYIIRPQEDEVWFDSVDIHLSLTLLIEDDHHEN